MSFSGEVKEELEKQSGQARHCRLAELAVLVMHCGSMRERDGVYELVFQTEHEFLIRKYFTLLRKTFNIYIGVFGQEWETKNSGFEFVISDSQAVEGILQAIKMWDTEQKRMIMPNQISPILLKTVCCKRSYLRGMYLCGGSMSDPTKGYHLEYLCTNRVQANQLCEIIRDFDVEAKIVQRKKYHVVYVKEGAAIVELLNVMEAHVSLMNLENTRILREIGNKTNRKVNCEAANIIRTVNAANSQISDITYIKEHNGLAKLPEGLRQMAEVRLQYGDTPLKDLGSLLNPPIGKSGVNHRLRKLSEIAEQLRAENETENMIKCIAGQKE